MDQKVILLKEKDPLRRLPIKNDTEIRYLSFNVNSIKTLFNYYPWNQLKNSVDGLLSCMDGDIVSLQELKVPSTGLQQVGVLNKYRAFVLLPKSRKGYSGVGLYVRIPSENDSASVIQNLTVVKAEEGISGLLLNASTKSSYLDSQDSIGGYLTCSQLEELGIELADLLELDSEGRCAIVELANRTVVFSLYCPANSSQTPEGEEFRIQFLLVLLQRSMNLKQLGKNVVLMGDINICPDLIDSAEAINLLTKSKTITNNVKDGGEIFERNNLNVCLAFKSDGRHRLLLNAYLKPTISGAPEKPTQFLYDTTRVFKKRQTEIYTVWNTQTNSRQSNYGSRIDLILVSNLEQVRTITRADILPYFYGSDHCPIFTDFDVSSEQPISVEKSKKLAFEAKSFYRLVSHRDISSLFSSLAKKRTVSPQDRNGTEIVLEKRQKSCLPKKLAYLSRKTLSSCHQPILSFFPSNKILNCSSNVTSSQSSSIAPTVHCNSNQTKNEKGISINSIHDISSLLYSKPPRCLHDEPSILKTSSTPATKGKKFWCCGRNAKGKSTEFGEHRCNFFAWASK